MGWLAFQLSKKKKKKVAWHWKCKALSFNSALVVKYVGLMFLLCNQNYWDSSQVSCLSSL